MSIAADLTMVKYHVNKEHYVQGVEEARGFAAGLQTANEKAVLLFREIIISRTVIKRTSSNSLSPQMNMAYVQGPLTTQQFLRVLQHDKQMTIEEWNDHIYNCIPDNS